MSSHDDIVSFVHLYYKTEVLRHALVLHPVSFYSLHFSPILLYFMKKVFGGNRYATLCCDFDRG